MTEPAPLPDDDLDRRLVVAGPDDPGVPHVALVGDTYSILVSGEQTRGAYTLIDMIIPPGGGPGPHRHDFEELFVITEGELEYTFRDETTTAHAGQVVNVPANAPHHFRNASDATARMLCMCTPAAQDEFFLAVGERLESRTSPVPSDDDAALSARIARMTELAPRYRTELLPPG